MNFFSSLFSSKKPDAPQRSSNFGSPSLPTPSHATSNPAPSESLANPSVNSPALSMPSQKPSKITPDPSEPPSPPLTFSSQLQNAYTGVSLFGAQGPLAKGTRTDLSDHIAQFPSEDQQPFTAIVDGVNRGMGTGTSEPLPPKKLEQYKQLTSEVQSGTRSNSSAMFSSAKGWVDEGNIPAASLNVLGGVGLAMAEGIEEHHKMKTGQK